MTMLRAGTRLRCAIAIAPVLLAALVALAGCGGEERGPVLSGGKEVKSWVAELHNPKAQVRRQAVLKLGNAGDSDPAVLPALAEALLDLDAVVRRDAIRAVAKLTLPSALIKERLQIMSRSDRDTVARDLAAKALAHFGGGE